MAYNSITVDRDEGVGVITLNRPEVLNALSKELWIELDAALTEFEEDDEIGALVLTGAGERAFSAGADIHEMARDSDDSADPPPPDPERAGQVWHIATCAKPTIGAINGLAYGGGAVIAASLDIRVGSEQSSFKFLAASYGRVNSTWNLAMQIGWPRAKELLFTARVVEAREAHRMGLLNHLVAADQLMLKALEIGKQIAANDVKVIKGIKELLIEDVGSGWEQMYHNELGAQAGRLKPPPIAKSFKDFLERKGLR